MTFKTATLLSALALGMGSSGCSIRGLAIESLGSALAGSAQAYATDDDPELVRDAMPFLLKTLETLLVEVPDDEELLLSACSGFTQYAYAFPEADAERIEGQDYVGALALRERALHMYIRARDYGLRALELRHPGIGASLLLAPAQAVETLVREDVEIAYWTAAAWGSAIGLALDRPELAADVDAVRALLRRALELDGDWDRGALHEALIAIEALPEAMGGSKARAREHFTRALELSDGKRASPYLSLALGVALPAQDASEFGSLLEAALAIDPDLEPQSRLANLITQRRAALLLERMDDLFLEPLAE